MTLNVCQFDHPSHELKMADTLYGPLNIWRWDEYQGLAGYCPAQDEVSKSIDLQGVWERADTKFFRGVLKGQPGLVLDFGSHIGWFAVQAAELGCAVTCFDADPENMRLLNENMHDREGVLSWQEFLTWTADIPPFPKFVKHVRLMKVDIEGHEHEALNLTRHLWQERRIDYGLWELSPIFEKRPGIMAESYAALVDEIASYGYRWFILKDEGQWEITGADLTFPQENAWAEKIP